MASIKKVKYGVVVVDNGKTYNFPLNTIIFAAEEKSEMVNIKLKSYRRTIMSIPNKEIEGHSKDAVDTCKELTKLLYYI